MVSRGGTDADIHELLAPGGMIVTFNENRDRVQGELLGFRADTAFVLVANQIRAVHERRLYTPNTEVGSFASNVTSLRTMRRRARYPAGLPFELEAALLARLGQKESMR